MFERLWKGHALKLHDECKNIAPLVTPEAMPNLPFARYMEGRRPFGMKRAYALKAPGARGFQLNVPTNDVSDIQLLLNLLFRL